MIKKHQKCTFSFRLKPVIIIFVILLFSFSAYAQNSTVPDTVKISNENKKHLQFTEVLDDIRNTSDYKIAVEQYNKSVLEQKFYRNAGDIEFNITPELSTQTENLEEAGQTDLSLGIGLSFPLGRSSIQEEKYNSASRNVKTSLLIMESAITIEVVTLYILYSDLWVLQQEEIILIQQKSLMKNRYEKTLLLYEGGAATLDELETANEDYIDSEESLNQNRLKQRLAWFALQQARNKTDTIRDSEMPLLDEFWFTVPDIKKPSILLDEIKPSDPDIVKIQNQLLSLNETAERLDKLYLDFIIKPFLGYGDYTFNAIYAFASKSVALNFELPITSFNESSSASSSDKWKAGISVAVELGTGKKNAMEADIVKSEIRLQELSLQKQIDRLSLELRSLYQKFIQSKQDLASSESVLDRQIRLQKAVSVRFDAGQALKTDLFAADLLVEKSKWQIANSHVEMQQAYLSLAMLLGNLPEEMKKTTGE